MRGTVGYSDRYINSTTRQLFLQGVGGHRWVERKDSDGKWIRGVLLEPARTQYVQYDRRLNTAPWTKIGTVTVTENSTDLLSPFGAYDSSKITSLKQVGSGTLYQVGTGLGAGNAVGVLVWLRRITTSGVVGIANAYGDASGKWTVDLAGLPDAWVELTNTSPYVTVVAQFVADASGNCGPHFYYVSGATYLDLYIGNVTMAVCADRVVGSPIASVNASVTRAVDSIIHYFNPLPDTQCYSFMVEVMLPSYTPPAGSDVKIATISDDTIRNVITLSAEVSTGKYKVNIVKDGVDTGSVTVNRVITSGLVHKLFFSVAPDKLVAYADKTCGFSSSSVNVPRGLTHINLHQCGGVIGDVGPLMPIWTESPWKEVAFRNKMHDRG